MSVGSSWVSFNVGGKYFTTTHTTINSQPDSMLAKLIDPDSMFQNVVQDEGGRILIDRDPKYFRVVVNFLRTGKILIDGALSKEGILEEARFFQITAMEKQLVNLMELQTLTPRDFRVHNESLKLAKLKGISLLNKNLSGINLMNYDFDRADIRGTNFSKCNLQKANLTEVQANGANFNEAGLEWAEMRQASVSDCSFRGANLTSCLLQKAIARNSDFSNCILKYTKLQGADLRGSDFAGCRIESAYLAGADLRNVRNFFWADAVQTKRAIITQEQYDLAPDVIHGIPKESFRFCIADEDTMLTSLGYFVIRGACDKDGNHFGARVLDAPAGTQIGLLFNDTIVSPVEGSEMKKENGIWYREVSPHSELDQPEPAKANEVRVAGWVKGILMERVSVYQ